MTSRRGRQCISRLKPINRKRLQGYIRKGMGSRVQILMSIRLQLHYILQLFTRKGYAHSGKMTPCLNMGGKAKLRNEADHGAVPALFLASARLDTGAADGSEPETLQLSLWTSSKKSSSVLALHACVSQESRQSSPFLFVSSGKPAQGSVWIWRRDGKIPSCNLCSVFVGSWVQPISFGH